MSIVGKLIAGTQGQCRAEGMAQAHAELPGGIHLIVVAFAVIHGIVAVAHLGVVAGGEIVHGRCGHGESDSERRILHGAHDNTQFHIGSHTGYTALIVDVELVDAFRIGFQLLGIIRVVLIVHIVQAHCQSKKHLVVDVAADVEIILTHIALMGAVEDILRGGIVIKRTVAGCIEQVARVDIVELVARSIPVVHIHRTILTDGIEQSVAQFLIGQLVLRGILQAVVGRKDVAEVTALVVVERQVDVRVAA